MIEEGGPGKRRRSILLGVFNGTAVFLPGYGGSKRYKTRLLKIEQGEDLCDCNGMLDPTLKILTKDTIFYLDVVQDCRESELDECLGHICEFRWARTVKPRLNRIIAAYKAWRMEHRGRL